MTLANSSPSRRSPWLSTQTRRSLWISTVLVLWAALALAQFTEVQISELQAIGGDVSGAEMSSDSAWVVYSADLEVDGREELYRVAASGGSSLKLSHALDAGDQVCRFDIAADVTRVVYGVGPSEDHSCPIREVYSVPMGGGAATLLSDPLAPSEEIERFELAPDSSTVVYEFAGIGDVLYAVPIAGGATTRLSQAEFDGGGVTDFYITSDGSTVVYRGDSESDGIRELFSVAMTGGPITKLSQGLGANLAVFGFEVSPDETTVVYTGDDEVDLRTDVYAVPISGGTVVRLNLALASQDVESDVFITPDSSTVVFRADPDVGGRNELFAVPIDGKSDPVKISGLITGFGVYDYELTPDGSDVLFRGPVESSVAELFIAPVVPGARIKLSGSIVLDGGVHDDYQMTADGTRVIFQGDLDTESLSELYSVAPDGTGRVRLNDPLTGPGEVRSFRLPTAGTRVIFRAEADLGFVTDLWSVPVAGGTPARLNTPLLEGGEVEYGFWSPDGSQVQYVADQAEVGRFELFRIDPDGTSRVQLNASITAVGGTVRQALISSSAQRVAYVADQQASGEFQLFSNSADGGGSVLISVLPEGDQLGFSSSLAMGGQRVVYDTMTLGSKVPRHEGGPESARSLYSSALEGASTVRLDDPLGGPMGEASVGNYRVSPNSLLVAYEGEQDLADDEELYVVPGEGGASTRVSRVTAWQSSIREFDWTPNSSHILYISSENDSSVRELYAYDVDAGTWETLSGPLVAFAAILYFDRNEDRVVFPSDRTSNGKYEVWGNDIGGGVPEKLSGTADITTSIRDIEITADDQWVVYLADQVENETFELFAVGVDAPPDPVSTEGCAAEGCGPVPDRLFELAGDRYLSDHWLAPTSTHVVVRLTDDFSRDDDLVSAPLPPSDTLIPLHPELAPGAEVNEVALVRDRAVYTVDDGTVGIDELYSVRLDGTDRVRLNDPLPVGVQVEGFAVSDGEPWVAYAADHDADGRAELYRVSLVGGTVERVSDVAVLGGGVQSDLLYAEGGRYLLFEGDQDVQGVNDLWLVEDPAFLFVDGFESGGVTNWSNSNP